MSDPKPSAKEPEASSQVASFIRPHEVDETAIPPNPLSSTTALAEAIDECDEFIERWSARHFSLSVKLHDVKRDGASAEDGEELTAILADLDIVQGVLIELHGYAEAHEPVQALMRSTHVVQHGVIAVYAWLGEILAALSMRAVTRRRPSFVDECDAAPAITMLRTLERLHPDLERLVRMEAIPGDAEVSGKLALCFRQIGAAIVRISGRTTTLPPPR